MNDTLFDYSSGRFRINDRATSKQGAQSVAYRAGSQKAKLLQVFMNAYPESLTDEEAAMRAGLPLTSCYWKRCGELRQDNKIVEVNGTRKGSAGVDRILSQYQP